MLGLKQRTNYRGVNMAEFTASEVLSLAADQNNAEQFAKILKIASGIDMDWVNSEDVDFDGLAYILEEIRSAYDGIS